MYMAHSITLSQEFLNETLIKKIVLEGLQDCKISAYRFLFSRGKAYPKCSKGARNPAFSSRHRKELYGGHESHFSRRQVYFFTFLGRRNKCQKQTIFLLVAFLQSQ